jgi:bifunctional ADP-heptose synthase (sugar kinase/adenylyltransferase)
VRVFEYYDFVQEFITETELNLVLEHFNDVHKDDVVLVADYGHGLITPDYINFLDRRKNFLAINTQANAGNRGYNTISKYSRADFFTLNSGELQLELRSKNPDYFQVVPGIMRKLGAENAVITLGADGLIAFDRGQKTKVPALAIKIIDKVGAGDSVFAIGSLLAKVGAPAAVVGIVCNIVAAHEISQLGHRASLEIGDIKKQLKSLLG